MRSLPQKFLFGLALCLPMLAVNQANAQCCPTTYAPAPTVAYSPVVMQNTTQYNGWYLGKFLFNRGRPRTGTTYTVGYAPTVATQAGGTAYTVGYAPSAYTVGYAPAVTYRAAYRPTYPATYGPVVQTVSRPVVLAPIASACNSCPSACSTCPSTCSGCSACGVTQSGYSSSLSTGCSSCQSSGTTYIAPSNGSSVYSANPKPALAPEDNPAPDRSLLETQKPETSDEIEDIYDSETTDADSAATGDYWRAPPLFAPSNRVTRNTHPAPVQTAVYKRAVNDSKPRRLNADGWTSVPR